MKIDTEESVKIMEQRLLDNKLLYLVVSGSHAWGLERLDSDIDLRGVYLKPTLKVLSLTRGRDTIEFTDGIYDVQLYEFEKFLRMLCNHNGNMVNLLWLPKPLYTSFPIPWAWMAQSFMTRRLSRYYRGYAESQRKRAMSQRGGKALIYTYREMFSGLWAMKYGKMEHNFQKLWDEARSQGWYTSGLLGQYFPNPAQEVTDEGWHQFYVEWEELCVKLDIEAEKSPLPDTFDGTEACDQILKRARLYNLMELGGISSG